MGVGTDDNLEDIRANPVHKACTMCEIREGVGSLRRYQERN